MATKQKVLKALDELGALLIQDPGKYDYEEIEILAPQGKFWESNLSGVLCYEFDRYSMSKAELWDQVMIDIEQGVLDESEADA
jgi:hypothetical protein